MHIPLFWKSISYACIILKKYILCTHYFGEVFIMHTVFCNIISYAYTILEEYFLCIQYFVRVYLLYSIAYFV